MTTDLEKKFFDTFGIKQREYTQCTLMGCKYVYKNCNNCQFHNIYKVDYPEITDRILLELLVIMTRYTDIIDGFDNVQELKEFVLKDLIYSLTQPECNIVKQQARTIFEEG